MGKKGKTEENIDAFTAAARGPTGKIRPPPPTTGNSGSKRKPLGDLEKDDNAECDDQCKKFKEGTAAERLDHMVKSTSLVQNRFKCVPLLITLLVVGDILVLTFPLTRQTHLRKFFVDKGVNVDNCFKTELATNDGTQIALFGKVVENTPLVSNPWEFLRDEKDGGVNGDSLYADGGGIVLNLCGFDGDYSSDNRIVVSYADASCDAVDLWTEHHVAHFDEMTQEFSKMEPTDQIRLLVHMSKEVDPVQQVWCSREFYR